MRAAICPAVVLCAVAALSSMALQNDKPRTLVLDNARIIDGTGAAAIDNGRIVIDGDRITRVGPAAEVNAPAGADRIDLTGRTIIPGLIDLHFHIERDPKMALRQLRNGITAFRDPGQWNERFEELRRLIRQAHRPAEEAAGALVAGEMCMRHRLPVPQSVERLPAAS